MQPTDFVAGVAADVLAVFEPLLPPVCWKGVGRKPKVNRVCLHALLYLLIACCGWKLLPRCFASHKTVRRLNRWLALDCFQTAWQRLAQRYARLRGINWDQGSGPPRLLQEAVKKGREATGPSPVDRRKCGTPIHVASDAYGLPWAAVLTAANVNDSTQTQAVLAGLVVRPPAEAPLPQPDSRALPRVGSLPRFDGRMRVSKGIRVSTPIGAKVSISRYPCGNENLRLGYGFFFVRAPPAFAVAGLRRTPEKES
jgi:transposase